MTALDLTAIAGRAERAYTWIGEDPNATDNFLPLSVREHFTTDMPALLSELAHLRVEKNALEGMLRLMVSDGDA